MFETCVNIFESILTGLIIYCFSHRKKNRTLTLSALAVFSTASFLFITYINIFSMSEGLLVVIEYLMAYLFMSVISTDKPGYKILVSTLPYNIFGIENMLHCLTFSYLLYGKIDFFLMMEEHRVAIVLLAQTIHALTFFFLWQTQKGTYIELLDSDYLLLGIAGLVCNLMTICLESVALLIEPRDLYLILGIYLIILLVCLIVCLFLSLYRHSLNEAKQSLELNILKQQQISNEKILAMEKRIHEMRHDMKHFISGLKDPNIDREGLQKTIEEYEKNFETETVPISTPSPALDYALNIKKEEAVLRGIDTVLNINLAHPLTMEDADLYLLVANMMDNAIEHIGSAGRIYVEVRDVKDRFMIRVTNSIDGRVLDDEGNFFTSEGQEHGYGVLTMRTVVKKYKGSVSWREEDGQLIAVVLLPLKEVM